jgi:hypothetical protein
MVCKSRTRGGVFLTGAVSARQGAMGVRSSLTVTTRIIIIDLG